MTQIEEQNTSDQINSESINVQITTIDINRDKSQFQFFSQLNGWYKLPIFAGDPHLFGFNETVVFMADEVMLPEIFHFNPIRKCYIKEITDTNQFFLYFHDYSNLNDIEDLRLIMVGSFNQKKLEDFQLLHFDGISKQGAMILLNQIITHDYTHEELDIFIKITLEVKYNIF